MDWNRGALLLSQCVVVIVLGVCVASGHNSAIHDGLLAVCGSIAGVGVFQAVKTKPK
jgi:hypothetical protein